MDKKEMVPILLPDLLDGSKIKTEYIPQAVMCEISRVLTPEIREIDHNKIMYHITGDGKQNEIIKVTTTIAEKYQLDYSSVLEVVGHYRKMMTNDSIAACFYHVYNKYLENKGKNYIITKSLSDALVKTKMTLKGKHIPTGISGYLEFRDKNIVDNDGEKIDGGFFRTFVMRGEQAIYFSYVTKGKTIGSIQIYAPKNEFINNYVKKFNYNIHDGEKEIKVGKMKYEDFEHVIVSSIIYIGNECEELKEQINHFSIKNGKRKTEAKIFTKKPYVLVGKNFKVPKVYNVDSTMRIGHFKWVWVGPMKANLELRWWREHAMNFNKDTLKGE